MKNNKKAFIFSLDAFIAFTLALVAIYSLIFFSSIPSAYYNSLTQAHYLAKDTLLALAQTHCSTTYTQCGYENGGISLLEFLTFRSHDRNGDIQSFIGDRIPRQYGYRVSIIEGTTTTVIYDTATDPNRISNPTEYNRGQYKLSTSSSILALEYANQFIPPEDPYVYNTCNGQNQLALCSVPTNLYQIPNPRTAVLQLVVFT